MKKLIFLLAIMSFTAISFSQNGQLKGKIKNLSNGEPIPFATIIVEGTQIYSTSDIDGNFLFTGLKVGFLKLRAFSIGYQTVISDDIMITNNTVGYIEIQLPPADLQLDQIVVKTNVFKKDEESPVSFQKITLQEIEANPGANRDISKVIQSFPGIGSTPAFRNDILVRGGGPSESRFFLDEVEIPTLNHFATQGSSGGPTGIINADFIQNVKYYSGNFPANRYNALSGVFDFKQKEGNKTRTNLQATLGASETALTLDGPIGQNSSYIFSVRRSYLQFLFSVLGLPFLPTFNDYQLKLKIDLNKRNTLTFISLGALDNSKLNLDIKNPTETQQYILGQLPANDQWSYTFGVVYKNYFSKGNNTIVFSRNMLNNALYKYPNNDYSQPRSFDYSSFEAETKFRYEFNIRLGQNKFSYGINTEYAKYYNKTYQQLFLFNQPVEVNYTSTIDFIKYGFNAMYLRKFADKLTLNAGFRVDGNNFSENMKNLFKQFSPRLSASFNAFDDFNINTSVGRYFQLPAYTTLGYRDNENTLLNKNIEYIGINQASVGFDNLLGKSTYLSLEGFYKQYFNYPIDTITGNSLANSGADYSVAGATPVVNSGKGRAYGFEVLNRINFKGFFFILSYTYVISEFTNILGEYRPSSWDSRHLLTITASKELPKNWRFGFKWRFVGGLPYTPYDLQYSSIVQAWDANLKPYLDYSKLNALRFKPFHQLDVRVDKNFFFKKLTLMIYFDVQNVYNFQAQQQNYVVREKNEDGTFKKTDNGTKYVLKQVENFGGTVLPTIGIIIKI